MAKETTDTKPADETAEVEDEVDEVEETDEDTDESGASEDNDETDEDDDDEEDVVSAKDFANVKKALDSERAKSKDLAKENRALKRQVREAASKKPADGDAEKQTAEVEKLAAKYRDIAVQKEAALALTQAGAKVSTSRLMKLLDLSDVDIEDDGTVNGLADAIEELKEESPEFFKSDEEDEEEPTVTKRASVRTPGKVDGGKKTPPKPKELGIAQQFARNAGLRFNKTK